MFPNLVGRPYMGLQAKSEAILPTSSHVMNKNGQDLACARPVGDPCRVSLPGCIHAIAFTEHRIDIF